MPSTGLESIDGVITKFLQDKDSLHCIALFNVTQLYENLKTENGEGKNKQKQDRTLLTQQQWMRSKSKGKVKSQHAHTRTHFFLLKISRHMNRVEVVLFGMKGQKQKIKEVYGVGDASSYGYQTERKGGTR